MFVACAGSNIDPLSSHTTMSIVHVGRILLPISGVLLDASLSLHCFCSFWWATTSQVFDPMDGGHDCRCTTHSSLLWLSHLNVLVPGRSCLYMTFDEAALAEDLNRMVGFWNLVHFCSCHNILFPFHQVTSLTALGNRVCCLVESLFSPRPGCTVAELMNWVLAFDLKKGHGPSGLFPYIMSR
jgi:hypothetical protein